MDSLDKRGQYVFTMSSSNIILQSYIFPKLYFLNNICLSRSDTVIIIIIGAFAYNIVFEILIRDDIRIQCVSSRPIVIDVWTTSSMLSDYYTRILTSLSIIIN